MLTRKQLELLEFIQKRVQREGVPPSFDEMKEALDLRSKSGIHRLITALEERGFIRRLAHRARAIEIVKLPESLGGDPTSGFSPQVIDGGRTEAAGNTAPLRDMHVQELQVMGRIAAGEPISAIPDGSYDIAIPGMMISGRGTHYALEVTGDSMIEAGINDGDIVVIRETSVAENGDIVVAMVKDYETTLKRFRREGGVITLEAANPSHPNRSFPEGEVKVQGKLAGLIRSY
jgi:repressor LexA